MEVRSQGACLINANIHLLNTLFNITYIMRTDGLFVNMQSRRLRH